MEIAAEDETRAVALLCNDVEVTIGAGHADVIRSEASTRRTFFNEPDTIDINTLRRSLRKCSSIFTTVSSTLHGRSVQFTVGTLCGSITEVGLASNWTPRWRA